MIIDLKELLVLEESIIQLYIRATFVFWMLFFIFKLVGRRSLNGLGYSDAIIILLVASALGDTLGGGSTSLLDGIVVAISMLSWTYIIDWLGYVNPKLGKLLEPSPIYLIKNGLILHNNMRKERITPEEIMQYARLNGVNHISDIKLAALEPSGEISIVIK